MKLMVIGGGGREHAIIKSLKQNPTVKELYCLPGNGGIATDARCVDISAEDISAQGGGREHAIIKSLKQNPTVKELYCLPGNGGIATDARCVDISAEDISAQVEFAVKNNIDYAVVAPDDPLALGAVDALTAAGIPCFGPTAKAATIESSKAFAKELMKKYNIPTAKYEIFTDLDSAFSYIDTQAVPLVIKADGLALGKGVIIAQTRDEAKGAVRSMLKENIFGRSGNTVVIEEFLTGTEVSVLAFTDGEAIVPMVSSMDHKRIGDNDTGLNTGGMGTIAPNPYYTKEIAEQCMETIFLPTIRAMKAEGRIFKGCLYFGLMLTHRGPMVIEYNCRFGDPEAQVVLPLLKTDLLTIMKATTNGTLSEIEVEFSKNSACCVIMASLGYPTQYEKGFPITVTDTAKAHIYVAGARLDGEQLVTSGGRVLGVAATADNLKSAIEKAYSITQEIHFKNSYIRTDIGKKALEALED